MRWWPYVTAARLPAYPLIALPLMFGVLFACEAGAEFSVLFSSKLLSLHINGILMMVYVLYINDYSDEETDKINRNYFYSGGSRVIAEGMLTSDQLWNASLVVFGTEMMFSYFCSYIYNLPHLPYFALLGMSMGWLYSLKPFQLSYKGFGEIVQGISLGIVLPFFAFNFYTASIEGYPYYTFLVLFPVFAASNIVHSLPDYKSDKRSKRLTFAVIFGEYVARKVVVISYFVSTFFAVLVAHPDVVVFCQVVLLLVSLHMLFTVRQQRFFEYASMSCSKTHCKGFVKLNMEGLLMFLGSWVVSVFSHYAMDRDSPLLVVRLFLLLPNLK